MKNKIYILFSFIVTLILCAFFVGCTPDDPTTGIRSKVASLISPTVGHTNVALAPILKPVVETNQVGQLSTNGYTALVTYTNQLGASIITNVWIAAPIYVTNVNYTVNPNYTAAIEKVKDVTPLLPEPWGTAANYGLIGLSALLAWNSKRKNTAAAEANDKADNVSTMLRNTIAGVERANDPATKAAIKEQVSGSHPFSEFNDIVQNVASYIKPDSKAS